MAFTNKVPNKTDSASVDFPIEPDAPVKYNKEAKETVPIRNLMDATVIVTGTVTGQQYKFHGAGDIVEVDSLDKDEILNKKRGRACCGGHSGKSLFELV